MNIHLFKNLTSGKKNVPTARKREQSVHPKMHTQSSEKQPLNREQINSLIEKSLIIKSPQEFDVFFNKLTQSFDKKKLIKEFTKDLIKKNNPQTFFSAVQKFPEKYGRYISASAVQQSPLLADAMAQRILERPQSEHAEHALITLLGALPSGSDFGFAQQLQKTHESLSVNQPLPQNLKRIIAYTVFNTDK